MKRLIGIYNTKNLIGRCQKEELVPFEKLLSEIESDDILIKNKYLFLRTFLLRLLTIRIMIMIFSEKKRKQEKPELKLSNK